MPKPPNTSDDDLTDADWELIMSVFHSKQYEAQQLLDRGVILLEKMRAGEDVSTFTLNRAQWTAVNKVFTRKNLPYLLTNTTWGDSTVIDKRYKVFRKIDPPPLTEDEVSVLKKALDILLERDVVNCCEFGLVARIRKLTATNESR